MEFPINSVLQVITKNIRYMQIHFQNLQNEMKRSNSNRNGW